MTFTPIQYFFLISALFLGAFNSIFAQSSNIGTPPITNYSKEIYHAGTQNWDIAQHPNGIIYFANNGGLLEFDGVNWRCYGVSNQTNIRSVAIDEKGKIYVGAQGEFGYFYKNENGELTYQSLVPLIKESDRNIADVWGIDILDNKIFIRTRNKILLYENDTIRSIYTTKKIDYSNIIDNSYLINSLDSGILKYNGASFDRISPKAFQQKEISGIFKFNKDTLLVTTINSGLFLLQNKTITPWKINDNNILAKSSIYCSTPINKTTFAIGTSNKGVFFINKKGKVTQHIRRISGLQNNNILSLFSDEYSNLWLGLNNGIDYIETSSPFSYIQPNNHLQGTGYTIQIHNNKIYFGTSNGVYFKDWKSYYNPTLNKSFNTVQNANGQVWDLLTFKDELLLNHHRGTFAIKGNSAIQISEQEGSWLQIPIQNQENLLLSGYYNGLATLNWENGWKVENEFFQDWKESSRIMAQDELGNVWVSHPYKGAFKVNFNEDYSKIISVKQYNSSKGFPSDLLIYVFKIGDKVVFEAMGHIYTRSISKGKVTGKAKRLTKQKTHFEYNPSFSRDGKKVVYVTWHDQQLGQVKVVSARGGKGKSLLKEKGKYVEPTFSPDGKTVVYRKISGGYITDPKWGLNSGVYAVSAKGSSRGSKPILITEDGARAHFGSSNQHIYLMRRGEMPYLARIDLTGKNEQSLYQGKYATEYQVSPNGQYLAFAEGFKVFVTPMVERGQIIDIGPKAKNFPVKQLSVRAGESINWNGQSNTLYWSLGPDLYQANTAKLFDITQDEKSAEATENKTDLVSKSSVLKTYLGFKQATDIPSGTIAFVGGKVLTMEGDKIIDDGVVLVKGNIIEAVGTRAEINIPSDAKIIDIKGQSIMPGLVDAHAHGPQGTNEIIPQQNWKNYAGLALGVTSIHDPSNDTSTFFDASEMQQSGAIVAARLFSTGTILYGASSPNYTSRVDNLDDAKFHIERLQKAGAFSVKSYNQPRRDQRQQLVQAARELKMMVVPEGGSLLQHNLTMLVDGHTTLEHSISTAKIYDDIKQLWSQSSMGYTPTLVVSYGGISGENYWYDTTDVWAHPRLSKYVPSDFLTARSMRRPKAPEHHYNHVNVATVAKQLQDLGIKVNAGGHGQREGLAMHWEMWMMAQGGMTPMEALRTATIAPAQTLGLDSQLGSLKAGKLADIIVINGDVSQDIRVSDKVTYTMINGRLYNAETMNEIGNYDNKRQPFYFED